MRKVQRQCVGCEDNKARSRSGYFCSQSCGWQWAEFFLAQKGVRYCPECGMPYIEILPGICDNCGMPTREGAER